MAIEIRSGRDELMQLLAPLNHADTESAVRAERQLSRSFGGSCQIPLAAYATVDQHALTLTAMVATPDGKRIARAVVQGAAHSPEAVGVQVAEALEAQDATAILAACRTD
jgi:hydroxymethylbilane synthase